MATQVEDRNTLRSSFERFALAHAKGDPSWLRERRTAAFARHVELGLPGPKDEAWRHTPTAPLRAAFAPADPAARPEPSLVAPPDDGPALVLVNGRFRPELSRLDRLPRGVEVTSLREALQHEASAVEPWLGRIVGERAGAFAELNTAFAEDGACVRVAADTVVGEPLHVRHVAVPGARPAVAYLRTLVLAGRGSQSCLVESFAGPDAGGYLVNAVTEVVVEDGARVDHYKLQQEGAEGLHVATLAARLGRDARFADHAVSLGAALARNDLALVFDGEGGEGILDGLFLVDGRRVSDTHSRVEHARPHCASRQLYKGVLDGQARGVFNGLVVVRPGAQKTDAVQTNRNLLLSREALVHSTPQLEILADDVKCKHGSTTGQLDAESLFYLRSRGIDEAAARSLLTWAFVADVLRGFALAGVRRAVEARLSARLPGVAALHEVLA